MISDRITLKIRDLYRTKRSLGSTCGPLCRMFARCKHFFGTTGFARGAPILKEEAQVV